MSLHSVISTGRGGAGNMIPSNNAANEIIMSQEEWDKYSGNKNNKNNQNNKNKNYLKNEGEKGYNHDNQGKIIASSGRGGVGNIVKYDELPSAKINSEPSEIEISPIFSTGRGGAGNIYTNKTKTKTKINMENQITEQLSPIHSNKSNKSFNTNIVKSDEKFNYDNDGYKFMKKVKNFFK